MKEECCWAWRDKHRLGMEHRRRVIDRVVLLQSVATPKLWMDMWMTNAQITAYNNIFKYSAVNENYCYVCCITIIREVGYEKIVKYYLR
jgi:hypothetical protein